MPKRIVIVDDNPTFGGEWRRLLEERYGADKVSIETYTDPLAALKEIRPDIDLLMLDLEMPLLDGKKFLAFACERGVSRRRVIITSARDADHLHRTFEAGEVIAVINKSEPKQQAALLMILDSLMKR